MIGIVVVSHGPLANGFRDSYRFFNDDVESMEVLCLAEEDNPLAFEKRLETCYKAIGEQEGMLILTDIPGGSPANQAQVLKRKYPTKVCIIAGCNLLMLLEASFSRNFMNLRELCDHCVKKGKESIYELVALEEYEDDDNETEF